MNIMMQTSTRIGHPILGVIIPAIVFVVSFLVTWALYRHFSKGK